ncbi:MAG TPA: putative Ig domain-containing protein [Streptosporangiaceae bacterium]|nr:putative Ig domain-containing protein [Streptosporangiaceae bacterium]
MPEQISSVPSEGHPVRGRRRWQNLRRPRRAAGLMAAVLLAVAVPMAGAGAAWAAPHSAPRVPAAGSGHSRIPAGLQEAMDQTLNPVQQAELTAPGAASADYLGFSVAIDGNTAVVGATYANGDDGAAYVFTDSGGSWTEQAELTPADGTQDDLFGYAVAISGNTIAVGAPDLGLLPSGTTGFYGAVYVFTGSGGTWTEQAELPAQTYQFGGSVALSGGTLVIGTYSFNQVFIYAGSGGTWTQQAFLVPAQPGNFGHSLAIDGDTVVVGAPVTSAGGAGQSGAAYVFAESGGSWTQQAELTATDAADGDQFGTSVAVSGGTVVVGAAGNDSGTGAAYVFTGSGTSWSQQAELAPADPNGDNRDAFGLAVALSGNTLLVGAPGHDPGDTGTGVGAAYLYSGSGATWTQQAELQASDAASYDRFGQSVAVSGNTLLAGAPGHDNAAGAAYVFTALQPQSISFTAPAAGTVGGSATLTATGGGSGNPVVFSVDSLSSGTGVCTVSGTNGTTVTYAAAGTCVIDANQAGNASYTTAPEVTGTITVNQAPAFVIDSPPATAAAGQLYDYTFTASGTPAPTYALASGAPSWLSVNAATGEVSGTPPSGTTTFSYSVTAGNAAGTATAGPFTVTVTKPSPSADISAALSCPASLTVGATGTCTLTITNNGPAVASKLVAGLVIPAALSQVSCSSGCIRQANVDAWTLASLASGASAKFSVTVRADRTGTATVLAAAASQSPDAKPLNNIAAAQITVKH